jgi:hypothetical protein
MSDPPPRADADLLQQPTRGQVRIGPGTTDEAGVEGQPFQTGLPVRVTGALGQDAHPPADLRRPA